MKVKKLIYKKIHLIVNILLLINTFLVFKLSLSSEKLPVPAGYAVEMTTGKYRPISEIKGFCKDSHGNVIEDPYTKKRIKKCPGTKDIDYVTLDKILPFINVTDPKTGQEFNLILFNNNMVDCSNLGNIMYILKNDPRLAYVITNLDEMHKIISEKSCGKRIK